MHIASDRRVARVVWKSVEGKGRNVAMELLGALTIPGEFNDGAFHRTRVDI